jgi:hypothetical protein
MENNSVKRVQDVPMPSRREIEARMVVPFLEAFFKEVGEKRGLEIASHVISQLALSEGKKIAEFVGGNSLRCLMEKLVPIFGHGGSLKIEIKEDSEKCIRFDVTECIYAKMYKEIGLEEYGSLLSCQRDRFFFEGFNPDFVFTRKGTIIEGYPCCDFCLELKK